MEVRDPESFSMAQTLAAGVWPLHTGEALGAGGRLLWFIAGQSLFFLYLSGLTRWLIRCGRIKDRPVNTAALRLLFYRTAQRCLDLGGKAFRLSLRLLQKARQVMPVLVSASSFLFHTLRRFYFMWLKRQKRIEKKG